MKKLLLICAVFSGPTFAGAIGNCTSSTLSGLVIGNPCALGGKMYSNFSNSDLDAPRIHASFLMADEGTDFRMMLVPAAASGFYTRSFFAYSRFADTLSTFSNAGDDSSPVVSGIIEGLDPENDLSQATGSNGRLNLDPDNSSTGSVTAAFASTALNEVGDTNQGLSSFELGPITPVPEPASLGLIGLGLIGFGLLRKSIS